MWLPPCPTWPLCPHGYVRPRARARVCLWMCLPACARALHVCMPVPFCVSTRGNARCAVRPVVRHQHSHGLLRRNPPARACMLSVVPPSGHMAPWCMVCAPGVPSQGSADVCWGDNYKGPGFGVFFWPSRDVLFLLVSAPRGAVPPVTTVIARRYRLPPSTCS